MSKGPFGKIDPNVKAQREFVLRQFANQVATGQARALDRINQTIQVGSYVIWRPTYDLVFQVTDLGPVMDPNAPPGQLRMTLSAIVPDHLVGANQRQMNMIVIGKQTSPGHDDVSGPKEEEPEPSSEDAALEPADVDPRD